MSVPATEISTDSGGERRSTATRGCACGVFRFADRLDVLLMALGTLGAVADGCANNLLLVFLSDVVNSLGGAASSAPLHDVEKVRGCRCAGFSPAQLSCYDLCLLVYALPACSRA